MHKDLGIPLYDSPEFKALETLLHNPWFSRAWTWQESFLARDRRFHCGGWHWSSSLMLRAALVFISLTHVCGIGVYNWSLFAKAFPMISGLDFWSNNSSELDFSRFLQRRRGSGCLYPSDLISRCSELRTMFQLSISITTFLSRCFLPRSPGR